MNQEQLFTLYEKLYFQELDRREKLSARLNIPLAILVATISFLSYMLNNATLQINGLASCFFWLFFSCACLAIAVGAWFFKGSWFGHTDKLLPTAAETENYREDLIKFYAEDDDRDQLVENALKKYLYDYYKQFSSTNTINNDLRAYHLYLATYAITAAVLLAFCALVPYFYTKQEWIKHDKQTTTSATSAQGCKGTSPSIAIPTPSKSKSTKEVVNQYYRSTGQPKASLWAPPLLQLTSNFRPGTQ